MSDASYHGNLQVVNYIFYIDIKRKIIFFNKKQLVITAP